jgi:hypothetical protein
MTLREKIVNDSRPYKIGRGYGAKAFLSAGEM